MAGIVFVLGVGVFFTRHITEFAHDDDAAKSRERVARRAQQGPHGIIPWRPNMPLAYHDRARRLGRDGAPAMPALPDRTITGPAATAAPV